MTGNSMAERRPTEILPAAAPNAARELVVLDVTLRDGGFHNAWDFDPGDVRAYLLAMDKARVDWAEVGYRSLDRAGFAGALRFSDEAWLAELPPLEHVQLALMIDAKEFRGQEAVLRRLFPPRDRSRVGLVRVAARPKDLPEAARQLAVLRDLGYLTTLNLMAWASIPPAERGPHLDAMAAAPAEVVYIADSYGSMHPAEVADAVRIWRDTSDRPFGVHLHNNLELAFANALAAIDAGARWIDAAVLGMGRGPGNLKTELLLQHLETRAQHPTYRTGPLYDLIGRTWEPLKQRYGWGPSAPYILSGHLAVHPTYAQELLESGRYDVPEVTAILHALHVAGTGRSYSRQALDQAISARPTHMPTRRSQRPPTGPSARPETLARLSSFRGPRWADREVLVIGRGPSVRAHTAAINRYVASTRPIVIECNLLDGIAPGADHLCAFILLANARQMVDDVLRRGKSVLLGTARHGAAPEAGAVGDGPIYIEPYEVSARSLAAEPCRLPSDVVSMFAIMQAVRHGATRIRVVGFDGYAGSLDPRELRMQHELEEFFALLQERFPAVSVVSLTRTTFAIPTSSLYAELALGELSAPPPAEQTRPRGILAMPDELADEPDAPTTP